MGITSLLINSVTQGILQVQRNEQKNSTQTQYEIGRELYWQGRYAARENNFALFEKKYLLAEAAFTNYLKDFPEHKISWNFMGVIYHDLGYYRKDITLLKKAEACYKKSGTLKSDYNSALLEYDLNRPQEAARKLTQVLKRGLGAKYNAFSNFYLGKIALDTNNDPAAALAYFKEAINSGLNTPYRDSNNYLSKIYLYQAMSYYSQENYPETLDFLQKSREYNPSISSNRSYVFLAENTNYFYGAQLVFKHRAHLALPFLKKVSRQNALWHSIIGSAYSDLGQTSRAVSHYQQCIRLDPSFLGPRYNLGLYYYNKKEFVRAEPYFRWFINNSPNYGLARAIYASIKWNIEKRIDQGHEETIQKLIAHNPTFRTYIKTMYNFTNINLIKNYLNNNLVK